MKSEVSYSEAFAKLEKLVEELEDGNIPLDLLAAKIKEANELIGICETKLRGIEKEVNDMAAQGKKKTKD